MSLSEGETSYICIYGANTSVLLASFVITRLYFWRVKWSLDSFSFKMSRISDQIIVRDSFTVLLDDSSKENQSLREQLRQRDEENALKFEDISNKVDSLCKLVAESNSGRKQNQRKVTQRSMCLQANRNQWNILYIYVKIFIYIYNICIFQSLSRVYKPLATLLWKLQNQVKELWK